MTTAARNYPINCGFATSTFARTFAKRSVSERAFDLEATEVKRVTSSGGTSTVTVKDATYLRSSSAGFVTDFAVSRNVRVPQYYKSVVFASENEGVLSSPPLSGPNAGIAVYQSNGTCVLRATSSDGEVSLAKVTASAGSPVTVDSFTGWVAGSLAAHCENQIDSRLSGGMQIYSSQDLQSGQSFTRNSGAWVSGVDLTSASPWNSTGAGQRAGTLISPRHVLFCEHADFHPAASATIAFVSAANRVERRTVTSLLTIPEYGGAPFYTGDITIGLLDADVGADISFAKVLPSDFRNRLATITAVTRVPVLRINQDERASVADLGLLQTGRFGLYYPTGSLARQQYYEPMVLNDSGNPVFLIINGEPVVLGTLTFGGAGGGSLVSDYISSINTAMTTLGGGYQLTTVDLSGFPTY